MQSALGDAEKYVDSRNGHMKTCMSMMQNMPGWAGCCPARTVRKTSEPASETMT
jgi:hypothetical protein